MVEFNKIISFDARQRALVDALNRIRERGQTQFRNPLEVRHCEPLGDGEWLPGYSPLFYVTEVQRKTCLFGIIPYRQYRHLFLIKLWFDRGVNGERIIDCTIFDHSLLDIVKEEVRKYADAFQVTIVNLTQDFVR